MSKMKSVFSLLLISLVIPRVFAGEKLALVVGINEYDMLAKLNAAVNDAERISAYYSNLGFRVWTLSDRQENRMNQPSVSNFERILGNLEIIAQEDPVDELVVFFAGHGVQIGGANFICFPETQLTSRTGMVSVDSRLVPWLRTMKAKLSILYLDACRNDLGSIRTAGVERGIEVVGIDTINSSTSRVSTSSDRSMAVFYASKSGEFSYEKKDGSGGFFTDTLLEALNADATVTVGELFDYVRQTLPTKTELAYGQLQIPRLGGDLDLSARFTKGKVDAALLDTGGRAYIEASIAGAEIWINGVKRGTSPLFIDGLAPGNIIIEAKSSGMYASAQLQVVRKILNEVKLQLKEIQGNVLFSSIVLGTNPNAEKKDVDAVVGGVSVLLDGKPLGPLSGRLISKLPPGTYTLALASSSWYWEQSLEIKGNDTTKVDAVLTPVGTISWKLPEGASVTLQEKKSGIEFVMDDAEGLAEYIPSGNYIVKYRGEPYVDSDAEFVLGQGKVVSLVPNLTFTSQWLSIINIKKINEELFRQMELFMQVKNDRNRFDTVGIVSLAIGASLVAGSGVSLYLAGDSYQKYLASTSTTDAIIYRSKTNQLANLGLFLGAGGIGSLVLSTINWMIAPNPAIVEGKIKQLETSLTTAKESAGTL
jgi:uncharacterized caspase-like protein